MLSDVIPADNLSRFFSRRFHSAGKGRYGALFACLPDSYRDGNKKCDKQLTFIIRVRFRVFKLSRNRKTVLFRLCRVMKQSWLTGSFAVLVLSVGKERAANVPDNR